MTAAERQAKRRQRLRKEAEIARRMEGPRRSGEVRPYVHGYPQAKQKMLAEGHTFERCRREWGFEEGVFVDGACVWSGEVVNLADLPLSERKQVLAERRRESKQFAVLAVECYMDALQVSLGDLYEHGNASAERRLAPHHNSRGGYKLV